MERKILLIVFFIAFSLLVQSFQCASPEMTSAKIALKNRDFEKAEANLEKELQNNPTNGEAYILLAEIKMMKNDFPGAAKTINAADPHLKDPKLKEQAEAFKSNFWRNAYNMGIDLFNKYLSRKETIYIDSAIKVFISGTTARPQIADFYPLIAQAYEVKGDMENAVKYNKLYLEIIEKEIEFAKEKGIFIKMPRTELIRKIGNPRNTKAFPGITDSTIVDYFVIQNNEIFVFSNNKDGEFKIFGWKINPPKDWPSYDREQPSEINANPLASLAQYYFNEKKYNESIEYIKKILILEPDNADVNSFLVMIYETQGNREEASKFAESLIQKDPNNKMYRGIYGDILLQLGDYDKAIEQYEKAIELDPNFDAAVRNCAVAYKNKVAVTIQKRQEELQKKPEKQATESAGSKKAAKPQQPSEPQEIKIDDLFPLIEKSIEYFEKSRTMPRFRNDFEILGELAQLYTVMDKLDKVKVIAAELEGIEPLIKSEDKERYLLVLLKIYDSYLKNQNKMKEIQQKLDDLKK